MEFIKLISFNSILTSHFYSIKENLISDVIPSLLLSMEIKKVIGIMKDISEPQVKNFP